MSFNRFDVSYVFMQQLQTFCRVVETGSFTRAAEELCLTQPAVTKQIKALENAFRARLLERRPGLCRLTPAGKTVYVYAWRVLDLLDACGRDLHRENLTDNYR